MTSMRIFVSASIFLLMSSVEALGLGELSSNTSLGENLIARIEIIGDDAADLSGVRVGLASADSFEQTGVSFNSYLAELSFHTYQDNSGSYVEITSHKPVLEPYLNLLVEMEWRDIQLFRKYALLIDPPGLKPDRIEFAANDKVEGANSIGGLQTSERFPTNVEEYVHGPVIATDTLWTISEKFAQDGSVTVNQMMLAFVKANPNSFGNRNVNFLRRGTYLRMPSESEIQRHNRSQAQEIVLRHHESWARLVSGKQQKNMALSTERVSENRSDRLEVVVPVETEAIEKKPEEKKTTIQSQLMKEEIDARSQLNDELLSKLQEAEGIISLLQKQVRMQDEQLILLQDRLSKLETIPVEHPTLGLESEKNNGRQISLPQNEVDDNPVYKFSLGVGGWFIVLVLLSACLILMFFIVKRNQEARKQSKEGEEVSADEGDHSRSQKPEAEGSDHQNFVMKNSSGEKPLSSLESLQPDLLEEINIHLAYEEYQKAESLVKVAIENEPDIYSYKLWLLRIYKAANNRSAFKESVYEILGEMGSDDPLRDEISTMWDSVFPDQSLSSFLEGKILTQDVNSLREDDDPIQRQPDSSGNKDGPGPLDTAMREKEDAEFDEKDLGNNLNLARAYIELGDDGSARKLLEQIVKDGNEQQRDEARSLLLKL